MPVNYMLVICKAIFKHMTFLFFTVYKKVEDSFQGSKFCLWSVSSARYFPECTGKQRF